MEPIEPNCSFKFKLVKKPKSENFEIDLKKHFKLY